LNFLISANPCFAPQNFSASYFLRRPDKVFLRLVILVKPQKYLAMIKISPNMAAKLVEPLMEFSESPVKGVTLEEAYQVFGEWDFALLFQADSNESALHFVGDKIRLVEGVIQTLTIPMTPIKEYRKR
jgi:uncharacterized protein with GYD domain